MRWILHDAVLKDRLSEAVSLLTERGDETVVVSGRQHDIPDGVGPTIGLVSVQLARFMHSRPDKFCPGVFWHPTAYSQTSWSPWFSRWMLNQDMIWVPFAEFARRGALTWSRIFEASSVFIRPDRGQKAFTGQVISLDDFDQEIRALDATSGVMPETLIGVCRPKSIDNDVEWRFWIGEEGLIAASPYSWKDIVLPPAPAEIVELAEEIARWAADETHWRPDRLFVTDLCLSEGLPRLIEINAASCSGVYGANLQAIFEGMAQAVAKELTLEP